LQERARITAAKYNVTENFTFVNGSLLLIKSLNDYEPHIVYSTAAVGMIFAAYLCYISLAQKNVLYCIVDKESNLQNIIDSGLLTLPKPAANTKQRKDGIQQPDPEVLTGPVPSKRQDVRTKLKREYS